MEKAIRDAIERGEFDRLPGAGRPLPGLDRDYDPDWWARRYVEQERARDAADELRRKIRHDLPFLRTMNDAEATERLAELNARIDELNLHLPEDERLERVSL